MSATKKMIRFRSSDNKVFEVEEAVALRSEHIKHMIEDNCHNDIIPLSNIQSETLAKVIEYCNKHHEHEVGSASAKSSSSSSSGDAPPALPAVESDDENIEIKAWDSVFVDLDDPPLFELVLAAHYLDIKDLLELTTQEVANKIKHKQVEEVRRIFNIVNDFTPEEEKAIREKNSWAFENDKD